MHCVIYILHPDETTIYYRLHNVNYKLHFNIKNVLYIKNGDISYREYCRAGKDFRGHTHTGCAKEGKGIE